MYLNMRGWNNMSIRDDFTQMLIEANNTENDQPTDLDTSLQKYSYAKTGDKYAFEDLGDKFGKWMTGAEQGYEEVGRAELNMAENAPRLFREMTDIDETDLSPYEDNPIGNELTTPSTPVETLDSKGNVIRKDEIKGTPQMTSNMTDAEKKAQDWWQKAHYNVRQETYRPIAEVGATLGGSAGMALLAPFLLEDMGKSIEDEDYIGVAKNAAFFALPGLARTSNQYLKVGSALGLVGLTAEGGYDVVKQVTDENFKDYTDVDPLGAMGTLASQALPIVLPVLDTAIQCRTDFLQYKEKLSALEAKRKVQAETDLQASKNLAAGDKPKERMREKSASSEDYFDQKIREQSEAETKSAKPKEEPTPAETSAKVNEYANKVEERQTLDKKFEKVGQKVRQDAEHPYVSRESEGAVPIVDSNIKGVVPIRRIWEFVNEKFTTARTGRIAEPGVNGYFEPKSSSIRVDKHNFLYTLSHEIGHFIDTEIMPLKGADAELRQNCVEHFGAGKYSFEEQRGEGIAEFFQTMALNPEVAKKHCPTYYSMVESAMAHNPELKSNWDMYSNMVRRYYKSTADEVASANMSYANDVSSKVKTPLRRISESISRLIHDYQDETNTLDNTIKDFEDKTGHKIKFNENPVNLLRQCSNSIGSQVDIMLGFYKAETGDMIGGLETALGMPKNTLKRVTMKDVHSKLAEMKNNAEVREYLQKGGHDNVYKAANNVLLAKHTIEVLDQGNLRRLKKLEGLDKKTTEKLNTLNEELLELQTRPDSIISNADRERIKTLEKEVEAQTKIVNEIGTERSSIENGTYDYMDSPLTRKQAQEIIANAPKQFEEVSKLVQDYNYNTLALGVHFGLLDPKTAKKFRETYKDYVPMYRDFSLEKAGEAAGGGVGSAYVNVNSFYHSLSEGGSTRTVIDPLGQMEIRTQQLIARGNKNLVALSFGDLTKLDKHGSLLVKIEKGGESSAENVVSMFRNGKKEYYQVTNDAVLEALNLDKSSAFLAKNLFEGYLHFASSTLRKFTTQTPPFMIWNALRDSVQAAVTTKTVSKEEFYKANAFYFFFNGFFLFILFCVFIPN